LNSARHQNWPILTYGTVQKIAGQENNHEYFTQGVRFDGVDTCCILSRSADVTVDI